MTYSRWESTESQKLSRVAREAQEEPHELIGRNAMGVERKSLPQAEVGVNKGEMRLGVIQMRRAEELFDDLTQSDE